MEKFYKLRHVCLSRYSRDPEIVKNRPDKSFLAVCTTRPELLLQPSVAFPDQVKCLLMNGDSNSSSLKRKNDDVNTDHLLGYFIGGWDRKFTKDLCKDLINFNNIEYFYACGLRLDMKLWVEFAQRSTNLKEIYFTNAHGEVDWFEFNEEALEALFKIPTLEKFHMYAVPLAVLPPGPSNIKDLYINGLGRQEEEYQLNDLKNLETHTNLKKVSVPGLFKIKTSEPLLLIAKNCRDLEELEIYGDHKVGKKVEGIVQAFEALMQLPKLKKFTFSFHVDHLVEDRSLIFPCIEYLNVYRCQCLSDESVISIFNQCSNLKSCLKDGKELFIKNDFNA
jgi:hypothetical protein